MMNAACFLVQHHFVNWRTTIIFSVTAATLLLLRFCRILRSCCRVQDGVTFSRDGIQHSHLNEAVQGDPSQACTRGLHSIGHSLPIAPFKMKNEEDLRPSKEECAVCLGEFKEGELLKHLPKCTHGFHIACIDTWFQGHSNCPLCRSEVDNLSDHECSISVNTFVESPSEDLSRDRSEHHAILRTGVLQNLEIRPHETL